MKRKIISSNLRNEFFNYKKFRCCNVKLYIFIFIDIPWNYNSYVKIIFLIIILNKSNINTVSIHILKKIIIIWFTKYRISIRETYKFQTVYIYWIYHMYISMYWYNFIYYVMHRKCNFLIMVKKSKNDFSRDFYDDQIWLMYVYIYFIEIFGLVID